MSRNLIKKLRGRLRVSQAELAKLTGVSRFKISSFECGHADLDGHEMRRIIKTLESLNTKRVRELQKDLGGNTCQK